MYHLELRHFPHTVWRFNLSEQALCAIVAPWALGKVVELGEHKWNPELARLTILEGPEIPLGQLTMGRGWRAAQRKGEDVTERVLAAASAGGAAAPAAGVAPSAPATGITPGMGVQAASTATGAGAASPVDPFALGVQMAALLGPDPMRLLDAWRSAAAGTPGLAPSETLALAEQAIRSD
ncbi:MAG TPA: hypothetical protein VG010_10850 [Solirubrobacteraceae bacterium]|jgi:hypothetical protein|nr:hypothetical protein [Solirubrobacteraceae bacterium]